jgi:23S rRNA pseudouridine1911/1915/1917 synthase
MSNLEISRAERLDQYVIRLLPELTRSYASKLIEQGKVTVNGEPQYKAGYKLRESDKIVVDHDATDLPEIPEIDLEILYEDNDCAVINKPVGLLAHSKGAYNPEPTVESWLKGRLKGISGDRAGIVHRLDRATSGVMIVAKTPEALLWLQKQFSQRKVKKTYIAVVQGELKETEAVINMPIERNPKKPQTFRVGSNGKSAITVYKVLNTGNNYSLVELKPETGRTHQLRVHLTQLGHPIVGDTFYAGKDADRLFLHAKELELTLFSKQRQTFTVPVPTEFNKLLVQ